MDTNIENMKRITSKVVRITIKLNICMKDVCVLFIMISCLLINSFINNLLIKRWVSLNSS